jgi:hypothetical protein
MHKRTSAKFGYKAEGEVETFRFPLIIWPLLGNNSPRRKTLQGLCRLKNPERA